MSPASAPRNLALGALLILVVGALVFGQVHAFDFVTLDDRTLIVGNPTVTAYGQAPLRDRLLTDAFGYAIPVTVASYALDWTLWGGDAGAMHLTSLAVHLAACLVLLFILARLVSLPAAVFGTLLFLLHPVQAEPVAFLSQRKDLLAGLFGLVGLWRALAPSDGRVGPSAREALVVAGSAVLAGLSKPSALLLGPVLAVAWVAVRGRPARLWERAFLGGLVALAPALYALNRVVTDPTHLSLDETALTLVDRVGLVGHTLVHYLGTVLLPVDLAPKVPRTLELEMGPVLLAVAVAAIGLWALVRAYTRRQTVVFILLVWTLGAYLPIANLIPVQRYAADSYLYLPIVGLALAAGLGVDALGRLRPVWRLGSAAVGGALLLALGALTAGQTGVWRDEDTLYGYLYRLFPTSADAVTQLTDHLKATGREGAAAEILADFYSRALDADPRAMAVRHRLMRLCLSQGDRTCAARVLGEAPADQRGTPAFLEAELERAMTVGDRSAALGVARALVALDPASPRKALLHALEAEAAGGTAPSPGSGP